MAIILDEDTRVIIQGITGREGSVRARFMQEYGTELIAGVTPNKGGTEVWGIPVYNTVRDVIKACGTVDLSVTFVPGPMVKKAIFEAITAGIKTIVMPVERVPLQDILEMVAYARNYNTRIIGPGSLGIISPGRSVAGWIGGTEELTREVFMTGPVGVMSRSGGQTTTLCWVLTKAGLGQSTAIHIGSEPIVGTSFAELLYLFQKDQETKAVVMFGEIGTIAEEEAAEVMEEGSFTKPLIAYITGATAKSGMRFSHASAIIEGDHGTAESKIKALKKVGATLVGGPEDIPNAVKELIT